MSTAGLQDLPLEIFSGQADFIPTPDLPPGASPGCNDVEFQMGAWLTRAGLGEGVFPALVGAPDVSGLFTYTTPALVNRLLAFDSSGNLYKETSPGVLAAIASALTQNAIMQATGADGRAFLAFSDDVLGLGQYLPFAYDDTFLDRVSQIGPGAPPVASDFAPIVNLRAVNSIVPSAGIVASTVTENGTVVTMVLPTPIPSDPFGNPLVKVNDQFSYAGDAVGGYNGTQTITAILSPTKLQFSVVSSGLGNSGGGTATFPIVQVFAQLGFSVGSSPFPNGGLAAIAGTTVGGYNITATIRGSFAWLAPGSPPHRFSGLYVYNAAFLALGNANAGTVSPGGTVAAGMHGIAVMFVTRQGLISAPSPVGSWTAAGGFQVNVTGIPTGPSNVVQRILCFTAANAANYFYIPNSFMVIDDNVTTSVTGTFLDAVLLSSTNVDKLFNQVELGEVSAFVSYALRMFAFGERNKMEEWNNLTFDGGFGVVGQTGDAANPNVPLGWSLDPLSGPGGSEERVNVVWGSAYRITGDGATVTRGLISQGAVLDSVGNPLLVAGVDYSVRVRVAASANLAAGTLRINAFSPSAGQIGVGIAVTAAQATVGYAEFIAQLFPPQAAALPADLVLRVYADDTPGPNGEYFLVDCIEVFPTLTPYNTQLARASGSQDPEAYNGQSGLLEPDLPDGDRLVTGFKLREKFYLAGARSLFVTADDLVNEPAGWSIDEVSNKVGTPSVQGIGFGEEWCVIAGRTGLYIIWAGAEPVKISQEIQPTWEKINWAAGSNLWVVVDTARKRILVGVPTGNATSPNQVLYMDYQGLDTAQDIASYHSVRYSAYSGKILAIGDARKWAPWTISAASCGLIERLDGTQHTFFGNGTDNGLIYDQLEGQYDDDGVGIPWSYTTHAMPAPIDRQNLHLSSGRMLFGYLSGYVEGAGQMAISAQPLGNITPTRLRPLNLINPKAVPAAIAAVKRSGNIVTVDTVTPHGLVNGVDVQAILANVLDPSFNGTFALQVVTNPKRFSVYQYGQPNAASSGGTAARLVRRFEFTVDVVGERVTWTFANQGNTPGTWAKMEELVPWLMPEPWAPVRGSMN